MFSRTNRISSFCLKKLRRFSSSDIPKNDDIKKTVYVSRSHDIFENLALEDWFYKNTDFAGHHILLLWQNNPCVVIGRHQNPWLEANVYVLDTITSKGVQLARRNSGGGTVYHDRGNLNLTFFTPKEDYNRKRNLELITRAIFKNYGVKVQISTRQDLLLNDYKISGTAAKIGRPNAYHHCTLLVDADKGNLSKALHTQEVAIESNATQSIKSKIMNLKEECLDITVDGLLSAIATEFMNGYSDYDLDESILINNQNSDFRIIHPTEEFCPGISDIYSGLCSWEWIYGKTPKFCVKKSYTIPNPYTRNYCNEISNTLSITLQVEAGRIKDINVVKGSEVFEQTHVLSHLIGHEYTKDVFNSMELLIGKNTFRLLEEDSKLIAKVEVS